MRKKKRFYPRVRNGKVEGNTGMFPHIVRHKEKEVLFFIGNGVISLFVMPKVCINTWFLMNYITKLLF